jgi:hypothetical protein
MAVSSIVFGEVADESDVKFDAQGAYVGFVSGTLFGATL